MHSIRLRGPWQLEPLARFALRPDGGCQRVTKTLPAACRTTMPADWSAALGHDFLGVVRYTRNFQRPTGLESGDKVWLVVEPPRSKAAVRINEHPLGEVCHGGPAGRFDITSLLAPSNLLEIEVEHSKDDAGDGRCGGLVGEVRLEIESS